MESRHALRRIARALEPTGLANLRAANRYARSHSLTSGTRDRIAGYRHAGEVGLHLLPDGVALDGLVVDAGANLGTFTALVRRLEPRSRVLAIEPVAANVDALRRRFTGDRAVTIVDGALSREEGVTEIHITEGTEFASLHPPREEIQGAYGRASSVVETAKVQMTTLDSLVDEQVRVLKIDVQGHEIPLLEGARATLTRTAVVLIEVLFVSHYENDALFADIDAYMREAGFALMSLAPWGPPGEPLLWADACYVPR